MPNFRVFNGGTSTIHFQKLFDSLPHGCVSRLLVCILRVWSRSICDGVRLAPTDDSRDRFLARNLGGRHVASVGLRTRSQIIHTDPPRCSGPTGL
jgi:hypothetical protein